MMDILLDYQGFTQTIGGVSRYHTELYKRLPDFGINVNIPRIFSENVYLKELGLAQRKFPHIFLEKFRPHIIALLNQKICERAIKKGDFDIFHPTFVNPYYNKALPDKPIVVTVHDLIQEKTGRADAKITSIRRVKQLDRADAVICVSQQTKDDLLEYYPQFIDKKIEVIYHGADERVIEYGKRPYDFPYILYVGSREEYKNFANIIRALNLLPTDLRLVCTGRPFSNEEFSMIHEFGLETRVLQQYVTDAQLRDLYHYAEVFVYPSTMEGFGIPLLESFRNACPAVASDIQCFHEVAGDGISYFDPKSAEDMASAILTVIDDSSVRESQINYGFERLKKFTWVETARKHAEVYNGLV